MNDEENPNIRMLMEMMSRASPKRRSLYRKIVQSERESDRIWLEDQEKIRSALRAARDEGTLTIDEFDSNLRELFPRWSTIDHFDDKGSYIMIRSSAEPSLLELFRSITCRDWFFVKGMDHKFIWANQMMEQGLGFQPSGIEGHSDKDFYDEASVSRLESLDDEVIKGNSVSQLHTRYVRGERKTYLDVLVPLRDREGTVRLILGISRDVTSHYDDLVKSFYQFPRKEYKSDAMREVMRRCEEAAKSQSMILLLGETGVGKDYLAHFIHQESGRSDGPYQNLNCAALPKDLVESELFGYDKGAFTGATSSKPGRIELADRGTLLLNEIGDLSLESQAKLLSFLDDKRVFRLGAKNSRVVDVRLFAATNKDLATEVEEGRFRADVYYRLQGIVIKIPPLRERLDDMPWLLRQLEKKIRKVDPGFHFPYISQSTLKRLQKYDWPGNVRELENLIVAMAERGEGELDKFLPPEEEKTREAAASPSAGSDTGAGPIGGSKWTWTTEFSPDHKYHKLLKEFKRALFEEALKRSAGNIAQAARLIGMRRETLSRDLKALGIKRDQISRDQDA